MFIGYENSVKIFSWSFHISSWGFHILWKCVLSRDRHSHKACRTICNRDQNEIKQSTCHFVLNQAIKGRFKEAIKQFTEEKVKQKYTYRVSCWNIKQSRTFLECNQAIKVNFCESKILIPFTNGYLQALWKWLPLILCILEFISVSGTDTLVTTYENFVSYRDYQSLSMAIW